MAVMFITHDMGVVAEIADHVVVMLHGAVVETGPVAEVFARPKHPYTAALIASAPEGAADQLRAIPGSVPPPHDMPPGCRFAPRCDHALPQCTSRVPETSHPEASRSSRCIRWKEVC